MRLLILLGVGAVLGIEGYRYYQQNKGSFKWTLPGLTKVAPNTQGITSASPSATDLQAIHDSSHGQEVPGTSFKKIPLLPRGAWF